MKKENQVVSLELAKKLEKLGVKQESLFYYQGGADHILYGRSYALNYKNNLMTWPGVCSVSAYTVAELGEMLPDSYFTCLSKPSNEWVVCDQYEDGYPPPLDGFEASDPLEVNARAKMLIHLLENKLITL